MNPREFESRLDDRRWKAGEFDSAVKVVGIANCCKPECGGVTVVHDPNNFGGNSFGGKTENAHRGRILLVDDEPLVLEVLEGALCKEGYEVTTASDAQAALLLIERGAFDGMVCDVRLENLDGFDLLMIARKRNPTIAGVLITGAPTEFDSERANELSAAYLSKPIALGHLFMRLDDLVRQSALQQDQEDERGSLDARQM